MYLASENVSNGKLEIEFYLFNLDIDECLRKPCQSGAQCINTPGNFTCKCPPGKTGRNCELGII